jgi:hypothetical protein
MPRPSPASHPGFAPAARVAAWVLFWTGFVALGGLAGRSLWPHHPPPVEPPRLAPSPEPEVSATELESRLDDLERQIEADPQK